MSTSRSAQSDDENTDLDPANAGEQVLVDYRVFVAGDHQKMVPLAGLLVDDPSLETAQMTYQDWEKRLHQFLTSEPR